jgi:hypothetical protein
VLLENVTAVVFEVPKVAVPPGTMAGDQFVAVFQSPDPGLASHVASCPLAVTAPSETTASRSNTPVRRGRERRRRQARPKAKIVLASIIVLER